MHFNTNRMWGVFLITIKRFSTIFIQPMIFCMLFLFDTQIVLGETTSISSFKELALRIESAPDNETETIIEIDSDIIFSGEINIKRGQNITIQSSGNIPHKLTQSAGRHFNVYGNLTLANIVIDGDTTGGGITVTKNAAFTILESVKIINCFSSSSGGGVSLTGGNFTMKGGVISSNTAMTGGGGIYIHDSIADISGGVITSNTALGSNEGYSGYGGGVCVNQSTVNITGNTKIANNTAAASTSMTDIKGGIGGGILVLNNSNINISGDVQIVNNKAVGSNDTGSYGIGGGIHIRNSTMNLSGHVRISDNQAAGKGYGGGILAEGNTKHSIIISGNTQISNNTAGQDGGGIYTTDLTYHNLSIGTETVFSGNMASAAYTPPEDVANVYPNIRFASSSIYNHPLNNYDINYTSGVFLTFHVTYDANGGAGSHTGLHILPSHTDTILSPAETGIEYAGHNFVNWNTQADGSGISYSPQDEITLNDNITLYAVWAKITDTPKTGDNSIIMWIYMLGLLFVSIVVLFWIHCKKKFQNG